MNDARADSNPILIARALAGAWRASTEPLELSPEELSRVTPLLIGSGAAGLGWWRARATPLGATQAALKLRQAYLVSSLQAAFSERAIKEVFAALRSAGVEPILIKGWAIARHYPESGLRPYGDVDICVHPYQYGAAEATVKNIERRNYQIDLHRGVENLDHHSFESLFARSQLVKLDGADVRVLSDEDHLRLVAVHMLRHGAWRPLWLCDIAVAIESRSESFDWSLCLGENSLRAGWVACAIGLARSLLGARIDDTPVARRAARLPRWLVSSVLKQWQTPFSTEQAPLSYSRPMAYYFRHPSGLLKDIRKRWPGPIEATINVRGPINRLPRFPFQLGDCLTRTARFLAQLPRLLKQ
jgi:hypothetical protein